MSDNPTKTSSTPPIPQEKPFDMAEATRALRALATLANKWRSEGVLDDMLADAGLTPRQADSQADNGRGAVS